MARFERRGYGSSRSPERHRFYRMSVLPPVVAVLFLAVAVFAVAQDVNVHIEPRKSDPANAAGKPDAAATKPDKDTKDTAPDQRTHTKPILVDVDLVLVNVTVTDDWNRIVTGLEKDNFAIVEGSQAQEVKHFSSEDAPVSLGVIFDMSGSMSDKIEKAREAVVEFFKTANPQDEFFMIAFSDRPQLTADFTKSVEDVQAKLVFIQAQGRTALLDAIYMGVSKMKDAHNSKKALLIISDGGDNHSRYTENEIKSMVKEADVQVYAIGLFTAGAGQPEEIAGPGLLSDITEVTGGRMFTINNPNELADVATKIGIELRNQYVLGYRPKNKTKDGRWRKIKVRLIPPKGLPHLNVYNKTGYYAPSQ
ncbi:MAG TPA: VWA domain-containing protein [Candidatus Angelobacter sp.]|jgi:Ca-activated chloride channel family protein|nr:VWA domain-containing protein [Candidatus Angelobacter sp.]